MERLISEANYSLIVAKQINGLRTLTNEYLLYRSERARDQWWATYDGIGRLLLLSEYKDEVSKSTLNKISETYQFVGSNFLKFIHADTYREPQLSGLLALETQELISKTLSLVNHANVQTDYFYRIGRYVITMFLASLLIYLILNIILMLRAVLHPIKKIITGVDMITKGKLDYRIQLKTKNEFGRLADAFNHMSMSLQESYAGLEKKIAERTQELRQSQAKDEAIISSFTDGLLAVNKNGSVMIANKAFEKLIGWEEHELQDKYFFEYIPLVSELGENVFERDYPLIKALKGATNTLTVVCKRKDGTLFPAMISAAPVLMKKEIIGAIAVFRDLTKEREIERLRTSFLSLASHQLRTPLSGTKWLIETLQRKTIGSINEKQAKYLDQIYSMNERMIRLVFDLLNVLKIEAGVSMLKMENIPIHKLFSDVMAMVLPEAKRRNVEIRVETQSKEFISIESDFLMLRTILETLLSNAVNYSSEGQEVLFSAEKQGTSILFSVRDHGIGIPISEQSNIFQKFYRASNAASFKPGGTGLGLYIAGMLAEKMGGKISFESKENEGSLFTLHLSVKK